MENKKSQSTPAKAPAKQVLQKAPTQKKATPSTNVSANPKVPAQNVQKPVSKAPIAPKPSQYVPAVAPKDKRANEKSASKGFFVKLWHLIVAIVVVVALVAGSIYLGSLLGANKPQDQNQEENSTEDYTTPITDNTPDNPAKITLPGYPPFEIDASSNVLAIELSNPEGNPCYFQYTLTIVETGKEIYRSALIAPGESPTQQIPLDQPLAKGIYTLRIAIDTFSLTDGTTPMNGGVQEVQLTVK